MNSTLQRKLRSSYIPSKPSTLSYSHSMYWTHSLGVPPTGLTSPLNSVSPTFPNPSSWCSLKLLQASVDLSLSKAPKAGLAESRLQISHHTWVQWTGSLPILPWARCLALLTHSGKQLLPGIWQGQSPQLSVSRTDGNLLTLKDVKGLNYSPTKKSFL